MAGWSGPPGEPDGPAAYASRLRRGQPKDDLTCRRRRRRRRRPSSASSLASRHGARASEAGRASGERGRGGRRPRVGACAGSGVLRGPRARGVRPCGASTA